MTDQPKDAVLDESGFDTKLKELEESQGFSPDRQAYDLDDDGEGVTAFDDGIDLLVEVNGDLEAARPESGCVPDAPGDDEPIPDPPLEPLLPFDGNPPVGGVDDFFETLGGIPEPEAQDPPPGPPAPPANDDHRPVG